MQFNLIGPGRLGLALAKGLTTRDNYKLVGVYHPELNRANQAIETLSQGTAHTNITLLPQADITFITAPDDKIPELAEALSNNPPSPHLIHCSGIIQTSHTSSFHPLKAFSITSYLENNPFEAVDCAIEGDIELLTTIAKDLNATPFEISSNQKPAYHAAAIMASNYLVTLAAQSKALFEQSGIPDAHPLTMRLMQTSLDNLKSQGNAKDALTGPLARGDIATVEKHLNTLETPEEKIAYVALARLTLPLTSLARDKINALNALFETYENTQSK